jgi:hypothetical protein
MKKLRLDVDALAVTSFRTVRTEAPAPGTVRAAEVTGTLTCAATCQGATCRTSCAGGGGCTCYPG